MEELLFCDAGTCTDNSNNCLSMRHGEDAPPMSWLRTLNTFYYKRPLVHSCHRCHHRRPPGSDENGSDDVPRLRPSAHRAARNDYGTASLPPAKASHFNGTQSETINTTADVPTHQSPSPGYRDCPLPVSVPMQDRGLCAPVTSRVMP